MNALARRRSTDKILVDGRREALLDAAEACFVRNGFHRTTMQDIAREAAMSAANIYYYFKAKDDVVLAIAERDRLRSSVLMARLEQTDDKLTLFLGFIEQHLFSSRSNAILRLELWQEANRNPVIRKMNEDRERGFRTWFKHTFSDVAAAPDCDMDALFETVSIFLRGALFSRAVLDPEYSPQVIMAQLRAIIISGLGFTAPRRRKQVTSRT